MNGSPRAIMEALGLFMVAGSLVFVALQMRQEKGIALAQLNAQQLETFISRYTAGIESDSYLSAYSKYYLTNGWTSEDLDASEVAALELDSIIWWTYIEMSYESYREGLMTEEAWKEVEIEIQVVSRIPVHRAVYDYWWKQMPSSFTRTVDRIINQPHPASGT